VKLIWEIRVEVVELDFDQFMMFQRVIQGGEEMRANTFLAQLQRALSRWA
jgi:hypothetical protein